MGTPRQPGRGINQNDPLLPSKIGIGMTNILANPREKTRFLRFLVVGMIGAAVDFGIENLLHRLLGFPYVLAGAISFICAVLSNFYWNRVWTYPDSRSKPIGKQLINLPSNEAGLAIRVPI
jgi:putative flippase GtrA